MLVAREGAIIIVFNYILYTCPRNHMPQELVATFTHAFLKQKIPLILIFEASGDGAEEVMAGELNIDCK